VIPFVGRQREMTDDGFRVSLGYDGNFHHGDDSIIL
jgi:hypothetical protein